MSRSGEIRSYIFFQEYTPPRSGFTWKEPLVVTAFLCFLLTLLLPAIRASREVTRRAHCANQLHQIGLGINNYVMANRVFPPGTICSTTPVQPSRQYDVWAEAAKTEKGFHGTGFLFRIWPFVEMYGISKQWDFTHGIAYNAGTPNGKPWPDASNSWHGAAAVTEIALSYCPSRRNGLRPEDSTMMLEPWWTGGGTDYGGCVGRHAAFTSNTSYNLCDATMYYEPNFYPAPFKSKTDDTEPKRWGIFGRVNVSTNPSEITDGLSNTIMTGELQRISGVSKDGWAIGGPATLFTTGAMIRSDGTICENVATEGQLMNNRFWGSSGSDHPNGANYGMADGSVRFYANTVDPDVFALQGSMADIPRSQSTDTSRRNLHKQ